MSTLSTDEKFRVIEKMNAFIPLAREFGVTVDSVEGEELTLRLPYSDLLVGDSAKGTLHSGALTVLLDQTLGLSAVCSDKTKPALAPTLDLRIDHLGIAPPGKDILATASVYRATSKVFFVEGVAYCESRDKPIARALGTWVRVGDVNMDWLLQEESSGEGA